MDKIQSDPAFDKVIKYCFIGGGVSLCLGIALGHLTRFTPPLWLTPSGALARAFRVVGESAIAVATIIICIEPTKRGLQWTRKKIEQLGKKLPCKQTAIKK